uniref:Insoluble matrix shell protein 1-like n=1 Tax=Crassostrea virginica TaxID=6565 RepID=A0A8B8E3K7_CRAVI|nr:insoluble matrix shell protein 1-like [Crassostrea virginica]
MMMNFFNVPMNVRNHCNRQIFGNNMNNPMYTEMTSTCPNPQSSFVYQPERWNSNPAVQSSNNCYNYVNDIMTNTFAQPGRANGYMSPSTTGPNLQYGSELDGMVRIEAPSNVCLPTPNGNLAALVIWPEVDYHFYRLDNDGFFSHKPGQTAARNVDNSGQMIRDPRTADRGPYTVFHCFLETNSNNVNIM